METQVNESYNKDVLFGTRGLRTHYGTVLTTPITGVINTNATEWLHEDIIDGLDLLWEEHILTCSEEDHDMCCPIGSGGTVLIGFVETQDKDKAWFGIGDDEFCTMYMPSPKAEYSAIVGEIYAQVVRSEYVQRCQLCSPCYPGQGNLDEAGDYITYSLPPDIYGDREHGEIFHWDAETMTMRECTE